MSNVTDKLAELRTHLLQEDYLPVLNVRAALALIAAVEALRAELIFEIKTDDRTSAFDVTTAQIEAEVDKIITDAAPMLGERC